MVAYKIYKSGDNYEVYEYERTPMFDEVEQKDQEEMETWDYPENADRIEERRKQTLRENGNNLKRMARENFSGKVFFMTLTFAENFQDIDKADRKMKYMFKKFRENYGDTKYIGVREKQKRGAIHYHFLVQNETLKEYYETYVPPVKRRGKITIKSDEQKQYEQFFHAKYWKPGIVDITMIDFVDDTGAYLAKYLTKGKIEEMKWLEKRRLVLKSKDIKKVEPLCEVKDSGIFKAIVEQMDYIKSIAKEDIENKEKRKRVFTNGYSSKWFGKVMYHDIHLNRIASSDQ